MLKIVDQETDETFSTAHTGALQNSATPEQQTAETFSCQTHDLSESLFGGPMSSSISKRRVDEMFDDAADWLNGF